MIKPSLHQQHQQQVGDKAHPTTKETEQPYQAQVKQNFHD